MSLYALLDKDNVVHMLAEWDGKGSPPEFGSWKPVVVPAAAVADLDVGDKLVGSTVNKGMPPEVTNMAEVGRKIRDALPKLRQIRQAQAGTPIGDVADTLVSVCRLIVNELWDGTT